MPIDAGTLNMDAKEDLAGHAILRVKLTRGNQWRARLKVANWLIRLAGWIAWVDVEFGELGIETPQVSTWTTMRIWPCVDIKAELDRVSPESDVVTVLQGGERSVWQRTGEGWEGPGDD